MTTSCKGCTDRNVGCHSVCERYQSDIENWQKIKAKMDKERELFRMPTAAEWTEGKRRQWRRHKERSRKER